MPWDGMMLAASGDIARRRASHEPMLIYVEMCGNCLSATVRLC